MIHEDMTINKDEWTLLTDGLSSVCVQMTGVGVVVLRCVPVGGPDPDDADFSGALIESAGASFAAGGLPPGTKVFARSKRDGSETINVLAY